MLENSNVSVSAGSQAESIADHNSCLCLELMKFVPCGVTFLNKYRGFSSLGTSNDTRKDSHLGVKLP